MTEFKVFDTPQLCCGTLHLYVDIEIRYLAKVINFSGKASPLSTR
jgi:hypothetical protein